MSAEITIVSDRELRNLAKFVMKDSFKENDLREEMEEVSPESKIKLMVLMAQAIKVMVADCAAAQKQVDYLADTISECEYSHSKNSGSKGPKGSTRKGKSPNKAGQATGPARCEDQPFKQLRKLGNSMNPQIKGNSKASLCARLTGTSNKDLDDRDQARRPAGEKHWLRGRD